MAASTSKAAFRVLLVDDHWMHFEPDDDAITFRCDDDDTSETCSGLGLTRENYGAKKKENKSTVKSSQLFGIST